MELSCLPAVLLFPVLSYCFDWLLCSLSGREDPCQKPGPPTSPKAQTDEAGHTEQEQRRPLVLGYDDQASEQCMCLWGCEATAIVHGKGSTRISALKESPAVEANLAVSHFDWACDLRAGRLVDTEIDVCREAQIEASTQFWTWCPQAQSWYHKDDATGEEIWAPSELD